MHNIIVLVLISLLSGCIVVTTEPNCIETVMVEYGDGPTPKYVPERRLVDCSYTE